MTRLVRPNQTHRKRPVWLASWAVATAAVFAGTAGTVAAEADAAAALNADSGSNLRKEAHFKHPKLAHGQLTIEGTGVTDHITLRLQAAQPDVLQVDVDDDGSPDFSFKREKITNIAVDAQDGDDLVRIDEGNGAFTDSIPTTIDGGDGSDTISGGTGVETLLGGNGNDSIDGNRGNDVTSMGADDDVFVWDPGDGSDTVEGEAGADTMVFNGAGVAEQVELSANRSRLKFFRNPGAVTMDTNEVERVEFNALGGSDDVTVNDLSGTGVSDVVVDLAGTLGGASGDGQADRVVINGTNGDDTIDVSGDAEVVKVSDLVATQIRHPEVVSDRLEINTLAGTDTVDSAGLASEAIQLFVDSVLVL